MKIIKYGHSCILLNDGQTKILFDPGNWAKLPEMTVDAIIITHAHGDHLDIDNVKKLVANGSPRIITNTEVKTELDKEEINCEILEEGSEVTIGSFKVSAHGNEHATIHPSMPIAQNTGYLINDKIYHPGDALFVPPSTAEFLFLPVVAPWSKISETLDYITAVKPKTVFPIHDAFLTQEAQTGLFYRLAGMWAEKMNAEFIQPALEKEYEITI